MDSEQLIPADECCLQYNIEYSFISSLQDSGLIEVFTIEEKRFIHAGQLQDLEKFIRLYYDLQINIEGIETITHLLKRIKELQQENRDLKNRLRLLEI